MAVNVTEFTDTITRITAGGTGSEALSKFNNPLSQIETHLNTLASRIANQNSKSALVRKNVPFSSDVFVGALVYYNSNEGHSRFEPALASLLSDPGSNGASVEAPSSRVEGMVVSVDSTSDNSNTVTGTLLCGGCWDDAAAISACTAGGTAGTYYLSPTDAGHAVKDTKGHLRQPVLSYYGAGKFSLTLFYMAHDNHFHGSCELTGTWQQVTTGLPSNVDTAPNGALFWYDGSADSGYLNIGELGERTTAVFHRGVLQTSADSFVVASGYLWYTGAEPPASGSVTVFNSYPFAYDSPVVRSVESSTDSLTVSNRNGVITLTASDFVSGSVDNNAYAVSALSGNKVLMTPVVSGLSAGPGIAITSKYNGIATISLSNSTNNLQDAYSIHHQQTVQTSDGNHVYITFPANRKGAIVINRPITDVDNNTKQKAYVWLIGTGAGATFSVNLYWVKQDTTGASVALPGQHLLNQTLAYTADANSSAYAETASSMEIEGAGLLSATIEINNAPSTDVRLLRVGFRCEPVETNTTADKERVVQLQQVVYAAKAGAGMAAYTCVMATSTGLMPCKASIAENCGKCVGITLSACTAGAMVDYISQGVIQSTSFNMSAGSSVYVAADGGLTQLDPLNTSGYKFVQRVGTALGSALVQVAIETGTLKES